MASIKLQQDRGNHNVNCQRLMQGSSAPFLGLSERFIPAAGLNEQLGGPLRRLCLGWKSTHSTARKVNRFSHSPGLNMQGNRQQPCGQEASMLIDQPMRRREIDVTGRGLAIANRHLLQQQKRCDQVLISAAKLSKSLNSVAP